MVCLCRPSAYTLGVLVIMTVTPACLFLRPIKGATTTEQKQSDPNNALSNNPDPNDPVLPSCHDGTKNGDETDTDCGGSCPRCAQDKACTKNGDCQSNVCGSDVKCTAPCPATALETNGPVIFFTDLKSGPNTGGEGDNGVFITIYGERFGTTSGAVTIGGVPVARIVSWQEDAGPARKLDRIVVQPGKDVKGGDLIVWAATKPSNPVPFTVRTGRILLLDASVADNTGDGSFAKPFKSLYKARDNLGPGDTLYIKGTFTGVDEKNPEFESERTLYLTPLTFASGSAAAPIALIGYPGEPPTIGGASDFSCPPPSTSTAIRIERANSTFLSHLTLANLILTHRVYGIIAAGEDLRFIGLQIKIRGSDLELGDHVERAEVLGCKFEVGSCSGGGQAVSIGIGDSGPEAHVTDTTLAYSEAPSNNYSFSSVRVIQPTGRVTRNISVHDNVFGASFKNFIVADDSDVDAVGPTNVAVYNNVYVDGGDNTFVIEDFTGDVSITHNSVFNVVRLFTGDGSVASGNIQLRNNIFAFGSGGIVRESIPESMFTAERNAWGANRPNFDPNGLTGVAGFADPTEGDLRLLPSSVALDAGVTTNVCNDHDGNPRNDGHPDAGAFESP